MKHLPPKTVVIKVAKTGVRYTLMGRAGRQQMFHDYKPPLFGNMDKGEFYRAVTNLLAGLAADGWTFKFTDTSKD